MLYLLIITQITLVLSLVQNVYIENAVLQNPESACEKLKTKQAKTERRITFSVLIMFSVVLLVEIILIALKII
jgi:hypothetical protein